MLIHYNICYAQSFEWPDANNFKYSDYEINIINNSVDSIETMLSESNDIESNVMASFITNYKFDPVCDFLSEKLK